jgi:hypothetical protein
MWRGRGSINTVFFYFLFLDEKKQKSRASGKKAKNLKPG